MAMTLTAKGQLTIPRRVRDRLGIKPGSKIEFDPAPDGRIVLVPLGVPTPVEDPFDRVTGSAGPGMSTDELMALFRGDD
jgi:AbrB family looped-hinge helix DNA binding protein